MTTTYTTQRIRELERDARCTVASHTIESRVDLTSHQLASCGCILCRYDLEQREALASLFKRPRAR